MSIEFEGKDPTPKQLTELLQIARIDNIHTIFTQMQYSTKGAELVAHEIGAKLVNLNPYSQDYFSSLREIAEAIAKSKEVVQSSDK